jgi:hypothetical protein
MIRQWVLMPDQDSPMNLAIFYDAHPVAGDFELLAEAKQYLFNLLSDNAPFYSRFARGFPRFYESDRRSSSLLCPVCASLPDLFARDRIEVFARSEADEYRGN